MRKFNKIFLHNAPCYFAGSAAWKHEARVDQRIMTSDRPEGMPYLNINLNSKFLVSTSTAFTKMIHSNDDLALVKFARQDPCNLRVQVFLS